MVPVSQGRDLGDGLCCEVDGLVIELRPQDLSVAGVFVRDAVLAMDRELDIVLHAPIGDLKLGAQVVQVISHERARADNRDAGSGLLFINLGDDHRAFIGFALDAVQRGSRVAEPAPHAEPAQKAEASKIEIRPAPVVRISTPPPPKPSSVEAECARRALEQQLAGLQNKAPWSVLGIAQDADPQAAKQSFLEASRRYHPHAYARFDDAVISRLATELFIAHKKALIAMQSAPRTSIANAGRVPGRGTQPGTPAPRPTGSMLAPGRPSMPQPSIAPAKHPSQTNKAPSQPPPALKPAVNASKAPSQPPLQRSLQASKTPSQSGKPAVQTSKTPSSQPMKPAVQVSKTPSSEPMKSPVQAASKTPSQPSKPSKTPSQPSKSPSQPPIGSRRAADAELAISAGLKHMAASRFDEALVAFDRARALHPGSRDPELWTRVCRARAAKTRGRDKEAVELYRAVLELDPDQREALEFVGERGDRRKKPGLIGKWFGSDEE